MNEIYFADDKDPIVKERLDYVMSETLELTQKANSLSWWKRNITGEWNMLVDEVVRKQQVFNRWHKRYMNQKMIANQIALNNNFSPKKGKIKKQ